MSLFITCKKIPFLNYCIQIHINFSARKKWPEAEAIFAFITETLKRWKTFDNVFLILLSYTQYKNKNYEGFINTCFKILASTNITGDDEKIKYLKKMFIVARKNLTSSKIKKTNIFFIPIIIIHFRIKKDRFITRSFQPAV